MKFYFLVMSLLALGMTPLWSLAADNGGNPWREVVCYTKDSRNNQYSARGFRKDLNRVKRQALRVCQYHSERPSTCRLLRCRP